MKTRLGSPIYSQFSNPAIQQNSTILSSLSKLKLITLKDLLNESGHEISGWKDADILDTYGKFVYQSLKKLGAAKFLKYDYALFLDSDGMALREFTMRDIFMRYLREPIIWRSQQTRDRPMMRDITRSCAHILGRNHQEYGETYWALEG